jgi:hypothetical protein
MNLRHSGWQISSQTPEDGNSESNFLSNAFLLPKEHCFFVRIPGIARFSWQYKRVNEDEYGEHW